ncbi:hypothetical protein COV24_00390 [candidate division WWE3 bacterium CG10_big_fil_rev_8_21_14_0_10_32_10]|uniref:ATP synthase F1 complex delta/epsilon subunit N-terminal domain-containing protein n=1 Tax=candidate division WWE3 bacterium CG10_big_fil_rev_8_21_14_0_10_32_10 TaxID=1975090 RepID=A0A2H0RC01_UNCKA|nr:MAG: hypothetical protein COV24_00390 [candidate division WWE3 bacterium CG10_big_fil_rev_8_21_14_0_10_32_10]
MESKPDNKIFYVKVTSPDGLVFGGNVLSITSINNYGEFDILSNHANFITIIKDKVILVLEDKTKKEYKVDNGIIRAFENNVDVYLGIEVY